MFIPYPKAPHLRLNDLILLGDVVVEEKIDGSQFQFTRHSDGTTSCCSKSGQVVIDKGPFKIVCENVSAIDLPVGYTFYGEFMLKPKHNAVRYAGVPTHNVVIFDVLDSSDKTSGTDGTFLTRQQKEELCKNYRLDLVPLLHSGRATREQLVDLIKNSKPMLGGDMVEGVFIKTYHRPHPRGEPLWAAKLVSESFQEVAKRGRIRKEQLDDPVQKLFERYRTEPRWLKAIQHLRDKGKLSNSPKDIGLIIKEIHSDIECECTAEIMEELFNLHRGRLRSTVIDGFAQWYQEHGCDPINWSENELEKSDVVHSEATQGGAGQV